MSTRSELNKQRVHLCVDRFETDDADVVPPLDGTIIPLLPERATQCVALRGCAGN